MLDEALPSGLDVLAVVESPGGSLSDLLEGSRWRIVLAVGREVAARAGARLVGCTLELGGKNAMYVAADADVPRAAAAAVRDCFGGAGQTCTSSERLYVHSAVAAQFRAELLGRLARLRLGWTRDGSPGIFG